MTDPSLPDASLLQNLEKEALRDGITQQVVGAVVQRDNTVLLLKRPPDDFMGGIYELPSGKTEPGETLNQALARELHEETGLTLHTITSYLGSFDYTSASGKKSRQFNFTVTTNNNPITLQEHDTYLWAPLTNNIPVTNPVKKILSTLPKNSHSHLSSNPTTHTHPEDL